MVMLIDPREGSADLVDPMKALGVDAQLAHLEFGDIAFNGRGEKGKPLRIGVEYKKLGDYLASMKGRLQGHQLPGMIDAYDRRYLIIEGDFEHDSQGRMLRRAGRSFWKPIPGAPPAAEVLKRLLVMELRGGIYTITTTKQRQTCLWLMCLYRVWCDKALDEHKSHLAIYSPDLDDRLTEDISWFRDACYRLPGVGFERSKAFETAFEGSMENLMAASMQEIADVETVDKNDKPRRLGRPAAERIFKELHK